MRVLTQIDLSHVTRTLSRLEGGINKVDAFLEEVGDAAQREFGRIMDAEGVGEWKWKPLDAQTVSNRQRLGYGSKPMLQRTGAMRESFTTRSGQGSIFERKGNTLEVGSRLPYARHHQQGNKLTGLPARPILFMNPELEAEINSIAARYLEEALGG